MSCSRPSCAESLGELAAQKLASLTRSCALGTEFRRVGGAQLRAGAARETRADKGPRLRHRVNPTAARAA